MQQSQCFGETLYGHVFSDVELRYPSDVSDFWMLLGGLAFHKVLGTFHIYHRPHGCQGRKHFVEALFVGKGFAGRFWKEGGV